MATINTQKDFYRLLSVKTGKTQKELKFIWESAIEIIEEAGKFKDETSVLLPRIGRLNTKVYRPYVGVDPRNGAKRNVPANKRASISLFPSFKDSICNKDEQAK